MTAMQNTSIKTGGPACPWRPWGAGTAATGTTPARPGRHAFLVGLFALLLAVTSTACASRKMMVRAVGDVMAHGVAAFEKDDDLVLVEQALPANIKLLEALLESDLQNRQLLVLLARLYASYSFAFIDGRIEAAELSGASSLTDGSSVAEARKTTLGYYRKGNAYALRAIATRHPQALRQLVDPSTAEDFIRGLDREDIPALFWYGFTLSADINHNRDSISALGRLHVVEKTMQRVIDVDEAYFFGGAHLVLLGYYGSRSPLLGGKPEAAEDHYRRLVQMNGGGFRLADLTFARFVLYHRQDRREFIAVMNRILQAGPAAEQRFRLYNGIAAHRARIYLDAVDRLFIE